MISIIQLTKYIESGLNNILHNPDSPFNDPNMSFKIWATAGEKEKDKRDGNTVKYSIIGNLRSASSSNEANMLIMGYNGMLLDFLVPIHRPKTISAQTEAQLARIVNNQYPFIEYIKEIINGYFARAQIVQFEDADKTAYTITITAGVASDGVVDLASVQSEAVTLRVSIGVQFLEGGISAQDMELYVDGYRVPFTRLTIGRSNQSEKDVYSNTDLSVKSLVTATALSLDFTLPANADNTTKQIVQQLIFGTPNMAHFVNLKYADVAEKNYLMAFDGLQSDGEGISFAAISGSLVELTDNPAFIDTPDYMQTGVFSFDNSQTETLTFTVPECIGFISGEVKSLSGDVTVNLDVNDFVYNPQTGGYAVYLITLGSVVVTNASATFTVIKAAQNGK